MSEQYVSCPKLSEEKKPGRVTTTNRNGVAVVRRMEFMSIGSCDTCRYHSIDPPKEVETANSIICNYGGPETPRKLYSSDKIAFISPERMDIRLSQEDLERIRQKSAQKLALSRRFQEENATALGISESSVKEVREIFEDIERRRYPASTSDQ